MFLPIPKVLKETEVRQIRERLAKAAFADGAEPVTRGERLAAILWIQSLVRDPAQRRILFDLDRATQALTKRNADSAEAALLGASYHNLLRMWAEA